MSFTSMGIRVRFTDRVGLCLKGRMKLIKKKRKEREDENMTRMEYRGRINMIYVFLNECLVEGMN